MGKMLLELLKKHGLATFLVIAAWFQVVIPMRDGHLRFLDRLATSSESSAESIGRIEHKLDAMGTEASASMRVLSASLREATSEIRKIREGT